MFDRYDPRSSRDRDRADFADRSRGSHAGSGERDHAADRDPRDVFTRDLDLPRGRVRRPVRERDRAYEINGAESRMLATVGAFRVVAESDLHDGRHDTRRAKRHLEQEAGIRTPITWSRAARQGRALNAPGKSFLVSRRISTIARRSAVDNRAYFGAGSLADRTRHNRS